MLQFIIVQVLSFDIIVIRIYDKLANDNSKVGINEFISLCIWGKQVKHDSHILIYSWNSLCKGVGFL